WSWSRSRSGGTMRNPSRCLDGLRPPSGGVRDRDGGTRGGVAARSPRVRRTVQPQHCRSCGQVLRTGADHKLGRHTDCPATYDEDLLQRLRDWRREEAARERLPAFCVLTDATLTALAEAVPRDSAALLRIHGLGRTKVDKYGDQVLTVIADGAPTDGTPTDEGTDRRGTDRRGRARR